MLLKILNMLPVRLRVFVLFRLLDVGVFYSSIWLKYYLRMLIKTKDYFKTIDTMNSNIFCPYRLEEVFIYEVRENYKEFVCS